MSRHEPCECDVCKVRYFERNHYFYGKSLSARDLAAEQEYFNEKRWLINRTILGWGIVCGLEVSQENGCLVVGPGLALDCCGHELLVCDREALHARQIAEELGVDPCGAADPIPWALCLEYRECMIEPVKLPKSCDQRERGDEHNRIRDGYRLSVRHRRDACPTDHSESCCPYPDLGRKTSIHQALFERSKKCPSCKDCECVLLATGTLSTAGQQGPQITPDKDTGKYRRIVYTNPALGSLLHCFHLGLTHISKINWQLDKDYEVDEFLELLTKHHLKVTFDQEMNHGSVTDPRSCRLSIFLPAEAGCLRQVLIPVEHVDYADKIATYYFQQECIHRELRHSCKALKQAADVELILHGSMMLDRKGLALDAEFIDRQLPSGNGVQGGEFIAYFSVRP